MKKMLISIFVIAALFFVFSQNAKAYEPDIVEDSLSQLNSSLSDEAKEKLSKLGYDGSAESIAAFDIGGIFEMALDELSKGITGPLSAGCIVICVIVLSAVTEGYAYSLRYSETGAVMSAVSSLMIAAVLLEPLTELIRKSAELIYGASGMMLIFVPVMIGLQCFTGHLAGGYSFTVTAACELVSQISSKLFVPLLSAFSALAVSSGLSGSIRIKCFCDMIYSFVKWALVFVMSIFTAVLSLQSAVGNAADTLSSRAVRLTLSSMIPVVGSAVSEAYRTINGSVNLLRSSAGVLIIAAVMISFMPLIIKAALWLISINLSKCAAEALCVSSPAALLSSVASVMSMLIAITVSVMTVFIISAAALMNAGGTV